MVDALKLSGADTVVVTATETLGSEGLHDLVWQLEPLETDLVVATGVVDVAGPRIEMRPVVGLPLIHVEKPSYHGAKRSGKRIFDLVFAGAALVALAPVFVVVALLIKLKDRVRSSTRPSGSVSTVSRSGWSSSGRSSPTPTRWSTPCWRRTRVPVRCSR